MQWLEPAMPFSETIREKFQARAQQSMMLDPVETDAAYNEVYDQEAADLMLRHGCSEADVLLVLGYLPISSNGPADGR
jgi:hypothetical protein